MQTETDEMLACVDLTGSNRAWDLVWVKRGIVTHEQFGGRSKKEDFFSWVRANSPAVLAVDAPSGYNLGRTLDLEVRKDYKWHPNRYRNMRLCEAILRSKGIKLYYTPAKAEDADKWVKWGWEVFDRLKRDFGYSLWNHPGTVIPAAERTLIEVHPHASFVVGLGWIPQVKDSVPGQLERIAYLLKAVRQGEKLWTGEAIPPVTFLQTLVTDLQGLTWDSIREQGVSIRGESHDKLDALAGLVTAARARERTAHAVGDPSEGVIVLPAKPHSSYRAKRKG